MYLSKKKFDLGLKKFVAKMTKKNTRKKLEKEIRA